MFESTNPDLHIQPGCHIAERKQRLDALSLVGPAWISNRWYQDDGDTLFEGWSELGHEG